MVAAWPSNVSQYATINSYSEKPQRNVASFQPEFGPPKERRRSSISVDVLQFRTEMTFAAYDILLAFYRTDLNDGTLEFTRKHPRNLAGADQTFVFTAEPELTAIGPDYGAVSLSLLRLP